MVGYDRSVWSVVSTSGPYTVDHACLNVSRVPFCMHAVISTCPSCSSASKLAWLCSVYYMIASQQLPPVSAQHEAGPQRCQTLVGCPVSTQCTYSDCSRFHACSQSSRIKSTLHTTYICVHCTGKKWMPEYLPALLAGVPAWLLPPTLPPTGGYGGSSCGLALPESNLLFEYSAEYMFGRILSERFQFIPFGGVPITCVYAMCFVSSS